MDRLVRTSAKALVIKDGCMLAIKLHDSDGDFYIMPGGGQAAGELLSATVQREVAEETGISVKAKDALFIIEGAEGEKRGIENETACLAAGSSGSWLNRFLGASRLEF